MTQTPSRPNSPETPGENSGADRPATKEMADQVQQKAGQAVTEAKRTAQQVTGQAKQQATTQLESQKERVVDGLVTLGQALRKTSQQLHEQEQPAIGKYVEQAAGQVERATNYLRSHDVPQLVGETQAAAQRRPGVFLAAALALGFAGARFLMASGRRETRPDAATGAQRARGQSFTTGRPPALPSRATSVQARGLSTPPKSSRPATTSGNPGKTSV